MTLPAGIFRTGIFLACLVLFQANCAAASEDPIGGILEAAGERQAVITYAFTCIGADSRSVRGSGSLSCQYGMYRLENGPFTVYDNGRERLTLNRNTREAVRQKSSLSNRTADSSSLLRLLGFNPEGAEISAQKDAQGAVKGLKVSLKDGTKISVALKSVKYLPKTPDADYSLDTSTLGSTWTVTDLR